MKPAVFLLVFGPALVVCCKGKPSEPPALAWARERGLDVISSTTTKDDDGYDTTELVVQDDAGRPLTITLVCPPVAAMAPARCRQKGGAR